VKRLVVDASVTLAWFIDPHPALSAEEVRQALLHGTKAVVPALWHAEVANGLRVAERKQVLTTSDINRCLSDLEMLQAHAFRTSSVPETVGQTLAVARAYELTGYDAVYLYTARIEQLPLATLDDALRAAAPRAGVELFF
jgi:predicted nucleic acid-binding protein